MIVIIVYESNDREYKNIFLVFLLNKKKVDKCKIKVNIDTKLYTLFCVLFIRIKVTTKCHQRQSKVHTEVGEKKMRNQTEKYKINEK